MMLELYTVWNAQSCCLSNDRCQRCSVVADTSCHCGDKMGSDVGLRGTVIETTLFSDSTFHIIFKI